MDNNEKSSSTTSAINFYFFKDILKIQSNTYIDTVLNKIGILRNDLNNINQSGYTPSEMLDAIEELEEIYTKGAEKARYVANKTLSKMKRKIGFIQM